MGEHDGLPPPRSRPGWGRAEGAGGCLGRAEPLGYSPPGRPQPPESAGRPVRVSGGESVRCGDQAGAAQGPGGGRRGGPGRARAGSFPLTNLPGGALPARPGPALPSARPPPDRPGIPCGGMWLLAGPGGTQLAGGREGGARGAGGSERPEGTAGGGPLGGIPASPAGSAPARAEGRWAGVCCG